MAAKKKRLKEKIYPSDWLQNKPYERATNYDRDFIRVANEVLRFLDYYQPWLLRHGIGKSHYSELALFLTSHFEDFISEIGIWNTFIARNQELLGKPLPFYDLTDYESGELNPQDLSFLLWYFVSLYSEYFHGPDDPVILKFGQELYELLEERIDQVYVTDFYKSFLKIPDDIDFFELKPKLYWMAFEAYLPALHFNELVKEKMDGYLERHPEIAQNPELVYKYLYGFQEEFLFAERSSLSALSTLEWFAAVSECSSAMQHQILELHKRVSDIFLYKGHTTDYYNFSHFYTEQTITVHKESVTLDVDRVEIDTLFLMALVKWKGDWWLSGTTMGYPKDKKVLRELREKSSIHTTPFFLYSEEVQAALIEADQKMELHFLEFFESPIVFLKDQKEAERAVSDFMTFHSARIKAQSDSAEFSSDDDRPLEINLSNFDATSNIALGYVHKEGIVLSPVLPEIVELLSRKNLSEKESAGLFFSLFDGEIPPDLSAYLLENSPAQNIKFPVPSSKVDPIEDAPFLLRYFSPNEFYKPYPNLRQMHTP